MSEVVIDPQEYYVWLACENGWNRAVGFKAKIAGIDCSVVMVPIDPIEIVLVISTRDQGYYHYQFRYLI